MTDNQPAFFKFSSLAHKIVNEQDAAMRERRELEPVIGISMVDEVVKSTDTRSAEPRYICTLCGVNSEVDPMYQHLIGQKHRKNYIVKELKRKASSKEEILELAKMIAEKERRNRRGEFTVNRVVSDKKYAELMPQPANMKEQRGN